MVIYQFILLLSQKYLPIQDSYPTTSRYLCNVGIDFLRSDGRYERNPRHVTLLISRVWSFGQKCSRHGGLNHGDGEGRAEREYLVGHEHFGGCVLHAGQQCGGRLIGGTSSKSGTTSTRTETLVETVET